MFFKSDTKKENQIFQLIIAQRKKRGKNDIAVMVQQRESKVYVFKL